MNSTTPPQRERRVNHGKIFAVFFRIGLTSFGGGVLAYLRDAIVEKNRWMNDEEFLAAVEIAQILPGLNSTNIASIVGRKLAGPIGSIVAMAGLILPGALLIGVIGAVYIRFQHDPDVKAALAGVAAAAVGLLLQVALKLGAKQFLHLQNVALLVAAFLLVGIFHVSLAVTLGVLAPIAICLHRPKGQSVAPNGTDK